MNNQGKLKMNQNCSTIGVLSPKYFKDQSTIYALLQLLDIKKKLLKNQDIGKSEISRTSRN